MMVFPFLMLGLMAVLMIGATGRSHTVGLHVPEGATPEVQGIVRHLEQASRLTVVPVAPEEVRQRLIGGELSAAVMLPADLDTEPVAVVVRPEQTSAGTRLRGLIRKAAGLDASRIRVVDVDGRERSEERRVGKECRCRWSPDHEICRCTCVTERSRTSNRWHVQ